MDQVSPSKNDVRDLPDGYPIELEFDAVSLEGFHFQVRPIRPDDIDALVRFHDHLSDRSCFLRFFSLHPHLTPEEVQRFTHVDYRDRLALVAEYEDRLIAVGRYDRHAGTTEAEVAFVVADECQHLGIGSLLLDELASAARAQGLSTFEAETLEENRTMLGVFTHSGFPLTQTREYGTVSLRFSIASTQSYREALARRRVGWQIAPHRAAQSRDPASLSGDD